MMRRKKKELGRGYNTCEFCRARLVRDQHQSWRYSSVCPSCGRVQSWGTHTGDPANAGETKPDPRP
jgi:hypothetical protein